MAFPWAHDQIKSTDKLCSNAGPHAWAFISNCSTRRLNGHPWQHRAETGRDPPSPHYCDVAVTRWFPKWMEKQLLWLIFSVKPFLEKKEKKKKQWEECRGSRGSSGESLKEVPSVTLGMFTGNFAGRAHSSCRKSHFLKVHGVNYLDEAWFLHKSEGHLVGV